MQRFEVRPLSPADRDAWSSLWAQYLAFYQKELPIDVTTMTWQRFHDPAVPIYAMGAFVDGRLVGIVHYLLHYSCWTSGPYCYLQDLYVESATRRQGVGRELIESVYAAALSHGASRVYWLTHDSNSDAMVLYDRIAERTGFVQYRKMLG